MTLDELFRAAINDLKLSTSKPEVDQTLTAITRELAPIVRMASEARRFWDSLADEMRPYRSLREDQAGSDLNALYRYATKELEKRASPR